MKKILKVSLFLFAALALWLCFAPEGGMDPLAWTAPKNRGYVGVFAPNQALAEMELISLEGHHGPEDAAIWNGFIYTGSAGGDILKLDPSGQAPLHVVANTDGVPLGIEPSPDGSRLYIADAHKGLLAMSPDGQVEVLADQVDGSPILFADDLDIAKDGTIYFTDASTKFGAKAFGSPMAGSRLEVFEGRGTGRVLAFDPRTQQTRIVTRGLVFANGLAIHPDGSLLVNETGRYRVLKINPQTGAKTVWIDNLPGFPDNINRGPEGTFFLGLISPRVKPLDILSNKPRLRKIVHRLPHFLQPDPAAYTHIVQLDERGEVLQSLQDPNGAYISATGAIAYDDRLYVTSLDETSLAYLPYRP